MGYTRDAMCRIIVEDGVNRMEVCFVMCYLDQSLIPRVGGGGRCVRGKIQCVYTAFIPYFRLCIKKKNLLIAGWFGEVCSH